MKDFFSGGIAGTLSKTICAPMERIKLLIQTQSSNNKIKEPYKGIRDCFLRILKDDGVLSFWRGNGANCIRYFPTQALNFSLKDLFHKTFNHYDIKTQPVLFLWTNIFWGGCAGAITISVVFPLDFARTRLSVDIGRSKSERQFNGIADCLLKVYRSDGFIGIYRGFSIAIFGMFMYRGLYFGVYDTGKDMFSKNKKSLSFLERYLFAQTVVIVSESISYPTDTTKRRMMMQSANGQPIKYTGSLDCFRKIASEEGYKAFFKGNLSNIFRSFGSSLCLVLYDEFQKFSRKIKFVN